MRQPRNLPLHLLGLFSVLIGCALHAAPTITETAITPAHGRDTKYTLSAKGMHLAAVHVHGVGNGWAVTVDGVMEEPFDEILDVGIGFTPKYRSEYFRWEKGPAWSAPVVFSPDGKRHAYAARRGNEVFVLLDAKEVYRAPLLAGVVPVSNLHFSPDGKNLLFLERTADTSQSNRLMIDGKAATPAFDGASLPFFSDDASHWALLGANPKQPGQKFLILDGKDAGYVGESPKFTSDNRLVCIRGSMGDQSLIVDGKPLLKGISIKSYAISATGDIGATVIVDRDGKQEAFLNGKRVAENAGDFVFSPDGKHWALTGGLNQIAWTIVDGKKQREYSKVTPPAFSPDSSKCLYIGDRDGKRFVVVNGQEDAGNTLVHFWPIFSQTGNGVIYTGGDMMGKLRVYFNDHVEPISYRLHNPTISPDGKHFSYFGAGDANYSRLIVDGTEKVPAADLGGLSFYSPDSQHLAAATVDSIWIDGHSVPVRHRPLGFTSDSQHFVHMTAVTDPTAGVVNTYFVDGEPVATFSSTNLSFAGEKKFWESQPDGTIVFVGQDPSPPGAGKMKRITVKPSPENNVAIWSSGAEAAAAKAVADAAAAKAQAQADAVAAAEKAKADYAAATAAKRKAAEEAGAAKAQARQDALAAKAKARADAAAAKAKK